MALVVLPHSCLLFNFCPLHHRFLFTVLLLQNPQLSLPSSTTWHHHHHHYNTVSLRISEMDAIKRGKKNKKEAITMVEEGDEEVDEEEEEGGELGFAGDCDGKKKMGNSIVGRKGSGGVAPPCQAERCGADLSDVKRYYRRHKVCEVHAKAAMVIVAGLRQRFCQQCSRFHELTEFDDSKRSCRRRLAGHNERRRKGSSESSGESSVRKGCRPADEKGRIPLALPGNTSSFKHFQIR